MHRVRNLKTIPLDSEIERTLTSLRKQAKARETPVVMAERNQLQEVDTRALREYALPQITGVPIAIRKPAIKANNFEIACNSVDDPDYTIA